MSFKTIISVLLVVSLLVMPVSAFSFSESDVFMTTEEKIDNLFVKMNEICAEAALFRHISQELGYSRASVESAEKDFQEQFDALTIELEALGVKKIDPEDNEAVNHLKDIVNSSTNYECVTRSSLDDGLDFDMFLDAYSVFQVDAAWTVDGQRIPYTAVRIIDNKNYANSPLTKITDVSLINQMNTTMGSLLTYQFSFGLSQYLGTLQNGWFYDWALGNAFTILEDINTNTYVTSYQNKPIYTMNMVSVTEMFYCYVYNPAGVWDLCGVKANSISYARGEMISMNMGGEPYIDSKIYPTVTSSTGISIIDYISDYVRYGYQQTHPPGRLFVNGTGNRTFDITPGFASLPSFLY